MEKHKIFAMPFSKVYPCYVAKAKKKGRTQAEVDDIILWLTGYDRVGLERQLEENVPIETFFDEAPAYQPKASLITGVICGYRVEEIEHPLMKKIRQLDKLIDELAKGKKIEKILRD